LYGDRHPSDVHERTGGKTNSQQGDPVLEKEIGGLGRRMRQNQVIFSAAPVAISRSTAMLLRLLRLFVFAAAPVILVTSPARAAPEKVQYAGDAKAGTIVIQSEERSLYLITGKDQALKYPVGVGRTGQQWFGTTRIASKHIKPAWKPPASLRGNRSPDFYIEGGSPKNPMGAAALVLVHNELAIHGTNNPGSIGGLVSAGCIRMHNRDIMDLYGRVRVGTRVVFAK
jgi:lipoprotein-anchoring transpeptidase ErfK/SrfK